MKHIVSFAVVILASTILSPIGAAADGRLWRVDQTRHVAIDLRTGARAPLHGALRGLEPCWDSSQNAFYFTSRDRDEVLLDWGDLAADCAQRINAVTISYGTIDMPEDVELDIVFYENDDGFNSTGRDLNSVLRLSGLPHATTPGAYVAWVVTLELAAPIDLSGAGDLDGDHLGDFSYTFHFRNAPLNDQGFVGPVIAGDPNVATGAEDSLDIYRLEPNDPAGPDDVLLPGVNITYYGTFWFRVPFGQFYMVLQQGDPNTPFACLGDIEPPGGDCDVDLSDLAILLSNFGVTSGATRDNGDIQPDAGDGDVDLGDLSLILAEFGQACCAP
jgi:hypothetical protein